MNKLNLYIYEKLIVGYCLITVIGILAFGRPISLYTDELMFYASIATVVFALAFYLDQSKSSKSQFIRLIYPILFFTVFYTTTGGMMQLIYPEFLDSQLTMFEKSIFGINPTLYIDQNLLNVWVTEILSFSYFSYYFMIPGFMIFLLVRKDYEITKNFLIAVCLTFFTSYWLFSLYPIEGPRFFFETTFINEIEGYFFRPIVVYVINNGAVHGGCMPSSHFGVALVILLYCFKHYRYIAYPLLPIVVGLGAGTVWGRFHYISDVVVGGLIGVIAVLIAWKLDKRPAKQLYNERVLEGEKI